MPICLESHGSLRQRTPPLDTSGIGAGAIPRHQLAVPWHTAVHKPARLTMPGDRRRTSGPGHLEPSSPRLAGPTGNADGRALRPMMQRRRSGSVAGIRIGRPYTSPPARRRDRAVR